MSRGRGRPRCSLPACARARARGLPAWPWPGPACPGPAPCAAAERDGRGWGRRPTCANAGASVGLAWSERERARAATYLGGGVRGGGWGGGGREARSGRGAGVAAPTLVPQERAVADRGAVGAGAPARVRAHLEVVGRVWLQAVQRERRLGPRLGRRRQLRLPRGARGAGLPHGQRVLHDGAVALGGRGRQPAQQDGAGRRVARRLQDARGPAGRALGHVQRRRRLLAQAPAAARRQSEHVGGAAVRARRRVALLRRRQVHRGQRRVLAAELQAVAQHCVVGAGGRGRPAGFQAALGGLLHRQGGAAQHCSLGRHHFGFATSAVAFHGVGGHGD